MSAGVFHVQVFRAYHQASNSDQIEILNIKGFLIAFVLRKASINEDNCLSGCSCADLKIVSNSRKPIYHLLPLLVQVRANSVLLKDIILATLGL